jgi:LPXTG-motif cell wall-anchored protein
MKKSTAVGAAIAILGGIVLLGAPAGAATHTYNGVACTALLNGGGAPIAAPPEDITVNVSAPVTANSGDTVTITFPAVTNNLPANETVGPLTIPIPTYQDLKSKFTITGATFVAGTATHSGNATINGVNTAQSEAITAPNTIEISNPGPMPNGNLIPAQVTVHTVAGAVGSTIQMKGVEVDTTANLGGPLAGNFAVATCPLPSDVLSSTAVLAPPPPGAPAVKPDAGSSDKGAAVTIDVLSNDDSGANHADPTTLTIAKAPSHGTASVTSSYKVLYTPTKGYSGIDSFQYRVCAVGGGACAVEVVNVSVTAAPVPTTTTTVAPTTSTAVSPTTAVAPGLARTGSSSSIPLAALGLGLAALGGAAVGLFRDRRDYELLE